MSAEVVVERDRVGAWAAPAESLATSVRLRLVSRSALAVSDQRQPETAPFTAPPRWAVLASFIRRRGSSSPAAR